MKLNYATATQKKMADANKLCDAFDRAALGHPTEVVFNAGVVLLANVIAHQSETFSEAEDATDKLGVIVCRMAHALMSSTRPTKRRELVTDARADFSRARLGYANRGARFGERPFCVELTLNPGAQAVHHSHDGCYRPKRAFTQPMSKASGRGVELHKACRAPFHISPGTAPHRILFQRLVCATSALGH